MAFYNSVRVWYRGRLVDVTLRYGSYMSAEILRGKPLGIAPRDEKRLMRLIGRKDPKALTLYLSVG